MNNYSIENIKCLYGWLEENPNGRMPKNGYSVIVFDCYDTKGNQLEYSCGFNVREHIFPTKEEAWLFFKQDFVQEHNGRDFWDYVDWNQNCVVSTHFDEGGWTHVWIEKWEGFDKDIEVSWEFNGVKYKSIKALWEGAPEFSGHYMDTDHPYIYAKYIEADGKEVWHVASLSIELSDSFKTSCEEKKKELKAEEEERERRRKEYEESMKDGKINFGELGKEEDLPF